MGDATRPPYPLVAQRGETAVPPLWKPLPKLDRVVRSEAERTGLLRKAFQVCTPASAMPPDAGTRFSKEHLSAQPVGDFRILAAVRTGRSFV